MNEQQTQEHIAQGGGICGTCAEPAQATADNQGYSYCCNDRIEYDGEAAETVKRANCSHERTRVETGTSFGLDGTRARYSDTVCADCGEYIDNN